MLNNNKLRIMQLNLRKSYNHTEELISCLDKRETVIVASQEPYAYYNKKEERYKINSYGPEFKLVYLSGKKVPKAAIAIRNNVNYLVDEEITNEYMAVVNVKGLIIVSMYFNWFEEDGEFRDIEKDLSQLKSVIEKYNKYKLIILSDTNCRNRLWGDKETNVRGERLFEFILDHELNWLNDPEQGPTYRMMAKEKNNKQATLRSSYIDLSIINKNLSQIMFNWIKLDYLTSSDHSAIQIEFNNFKEIIKGNIIINRSIDYKRSNWRGFMSTYNKLKPSEFRTSKFESDIKKFCEAIKTSSDKYLIYKRKKYYNNLPYYNEKIEALNDDIMKLRRKLSHVKNVERRSTISALLRSRNDDKTEQVRASKSEYMRRLYSVENEETFWKCWNRAKVCEPSNIPIFKDNYELSLEMNERMLIDNFIKESRIKYNEINVNDVCELELTSIEELDHIINNMKTNKTPGVDNVTNKLLKILYVNDKDYFLKLFNSILTKNKIPNCFKVGKMIFLCKPNRKIINPSDLRPITLINGFCKITEALFMSRIENRLNDMNYFSDRQFGFRTGCSTVDAVNIVIKDCESFKKKFKYNLLIGIDISGAFDNISWKIIINNLINAGVENKFLKATESLLIDRRIMINKKTYKSKKGCPQGGKASPALWKIGMNSLLKLLEKDKEIRFTAYADDLSILIGANSANSLEAKLNEVWTIIDNWCCKAELGLNVKKTEFLLLGRKKIKIKLRNNPIKQSNNLKYLGVIIDRNLTFKDHITHLVNKTNTVVTKINRLLSLNCDIELKFKKRLYSSVFIPMISYASSVWFDRIKEFKTYTDILRKLQRKVLICLTRAYKNTKHSNLLKVIGFIDVIDELEIINDVKKVIKRDRAEFKRLVKIDRFCKIESEFEYEHIRQEIDMCKHRYTIWCLTNTGPFRAFLNKIFSDRFNRYCRYCGINSETSHHLLYDCEILKIERKDLESNCIELVKRLLIDSEK